MENDLNEKVVAWGKERNIVSPESTPKQFMKVVEEIGELSAGINKHDEEKIIDSMVDIQVTLILLAADLGIDYNGSLETAYNVIANRKWKTVNGVFIKNDDVNKLSPDDIGNDIHDFLHKGDQLQNKIELTKDEFELLAKVCRGIQPFQKIEKHIKIVQEKKWFVKLKKEAKEFNMLYIDDDQNFHYHQNKEYATYFDTKEEAELWNNPQTEVVLLPLEEK